MFQNVTACLMTSFVICASLPSIMFQALHENIMDGWKSWIFGAIQRGTIH